MWLMSQVQGIRWHVIRRGTVRGLPRYERCEGLADQLNERGKNVMHSCGGGIHRSCKKHQYS